MQAVAVGASVAYPLVRLARAIPNADPDGRRGSVFSLDPKRGKQLCGRHRRWLLIFRMKPWVRARDFGNQVGDTVSATKTYASERMDQVSAAVAGGTDQASRAGWCGGCDHGISFADVSRQGEFHSEPPFPTARGMQKTAASAWPVRPRRQCRTLHPAPASAGRRTIGTVRRGRTRRCKGSAPKGVRPHRTHGKDDLRDNRAESAAGCRCRF